jgi:hypothetical protein
VQAGPALSGPFALGEKLGGADLGRPDFEILGGLELPLWCAFEAASSDRGFACISGDSRFDPDADKMKKLEAHELLNAAGRAGRAGEGAQGFVLLVPSKVIDFDENRANQRNRNPDPPRHGPVPVIHAAGACAFSRPRNAHCEAWRPVIPCETIPHARSRQCARSRRLKPCKCLTCC